VDEPAAGVWLAGDETLCDGDKSAKRERRPMIAALSHAVTMTSSEGCSRERRLLIVQMLCAIGAPFCVIAPVLQLCENPSSTELKTETCACACFDLLLQLPGSAHDVAVQGYGFTYDYIDPSFPAAAKVRQTARRHAAATCYAFLCLTGRCQPSIPTALAALL
jgi:hypothetical protein